MAPEQEQNITYGIIVRLHGSYKVIGNIPLVRKAQVVSELGEPLAWKKVGEIKTGENYHLCRCGQSKEMPFCDRTHREIGFDGTENAPTGISAERRITYPGSGKLLVHFDACLCCESGFCANRTTSMQELAAKTDDIQVRTQVIGMIEHCPSGALTYQFEGEEADNEVDLPRQIAETIEITSEGPIRGPFWVTGGIPIYRADGEPFEVRNRVTLCSCGHSGSKPLCDGSHRTYPKRV